MSQSKCPVCGARFDAAASTTLPFCSTRCRQIDLGRWFDERYAMPVDLEREPDDDESDEAGAADGAPPSSNGHDDGE